MATYDVRKVKAGDAAADSTLEVAGMSRGIYDSATDLTGESPGPRSRLNTWRFVMPVNIRFLKGQQIMRVQRVSISSNDENGTPHKEDCLLLWFADGSRVLLRPVSRGQSTDGKWLWGVDIDGLGEPERDPLLVGSHYDVVDDTSLVAASSSQVRAGGSRKRLSPWWPESPQGQVVYWLLMGLAFVASTAVVGGGVPKLLEDLNYGDVDAVVTAMFMGGGLSAASWYLILTVIRAIYLAITQK